MTEECTVNCAECDMVLAEQNKQPCPRCGSTKRYISIFVMEGLQMHESLETTLKDPSRRSREKLRRHSLQGVFLGGDGNYVYKERDLDKTREPAWYTELVKDLHTGEVIRDCNEPLADHQGHGSAKFNSAKPTDESGG